MPIELAPKDGTKVDIWSKMGGRTTDAHFDQKQQCWVYWGPGEYGDMCFTPTLHRPTHFILPPANPE